MDLSEKSDVAETFKHPIVSIEVKTEVKQFDKEEKRLGMVCIFMDAFSEAYSRFIFLGV